VTARRLLASLFAAVVLLVHAAAGRAYAEAAPGLWAPSDATVGTGERVVVRTPGAPRTSPGHGPQPHGPLLATLPDALALDAPAAFATALRYQPVSHRTAQLASGRSSRGPPRPCPNR
jgi:hypothetical protein